MPTKIICIIYLWKYHLYLQQEYSELRISFKMEGSESNTFI